MAFSSAAAAAAAPAPANGVFLSSSTASSPTRNFFSRKIYPFQDPVGLLPKRPSPHQVHCAPVLRSPSSVPDTGTATPSGFDLRAYWISLIAVIDAELDTAIPCRYPPLIHDAMRYVVLSPGAKRATPILCLAAACDLLGAPLAAALPAACALEMAHAASLAHDDLPCMDAAPTRRGRPSAHAAFGPSAAVLAGDALLPHGILHVIDRTPRDVVPGEVVLRVVAEITQAVGSLGMAAGQFLDLDGAGKDDNDVITIMEKKFGEMAQCSAVCGGLIGGADSEVLDRLRRYGKTVGVLYEVVDDILMEDFGGNGSQVKMRNKNASVVGAYGMERALKIAEDLRKQATIEAQALAEKYGEEKTRPLQSFVQYAVERGFILAGGERDRDSDQCTAVASGSATRFPSFKSINKLLSDVILLVYFFFRAVQVFHIGALMPLSLISFFSGHWMPTRRMNNYGVCTIGCTNAFWRE